MFTHSRLILDANYLCHRAYHAMAALGSECTGRVMVFGFFKDLLALTKEFDTTEVVFCFDCGPLLRQSRHPGYKASRAAAFAVKTPAEQAGIIDFRNETQLLRERYLWAAGYTNIYYEPGYEADDIIAAITASDVLPPNVEAIIVSSDQDLWQLLRPGVCAWNPQTKAMTTHQTFEQDWGIKPADWPHVKALAGCKSDDIQGINRVGEKTAVKYMRGELKSGQAYTAIKAEGEAIVKRNYPLVKLPYPGCPWFAFGDDDITAEKWRLVMDRLGFRSLRDEPPIMENFNRPSFGLRSDGKRK